MSTFEEHFKDFEVYSKCNGKPQTYVRVKNDVVPYVLLKKNVFTYPVGTDSSWVGKPLGAVCACKRSLEQRFSPGVLQEFSNMRCLTT